LTSLAEMSMSGLVEKAGFSADLRSRLTGGFLLNLVGAACNQGSTLTVNVLVSNLYGPKVFGEYAAIQATIATGAAIASFGTGYTTTKYVAELRSADPQRASRILGLCAGVACVTALIMTAILFGGASWIAERSLHASRLAPGLRIASCAIFFNVLNWYLMGGLSGLEAYRSLARAGVVSGAAYLVLCSLGTWLGGLEGTLAGVALSAAFQTLVLLAFLTREARNQGLRIQLADAWTERNVLWRFAVPSALPGFTTMPAIWIANLVLLRQPDGYAQLGFYSAAYNFRTMTVFLPSVLAKLVPIEKTVRIEPRTAAATLVEAAEPFLDRLAGGSFFVRLERRGLKGQLHTPTLEREVAEPVWQALERRGATPRVDFADPDSILVIETIGEVAGLAVLDRALRRDYPFVKVR